MEHDPQISIVLTNLSSNRPSPAPMQPESTLNQLKASQPNGQLPSSYGVYFKNTLVALCHALEDHIQEASAASPEHQPLVLVTFQQGKWYLQEADRYFELAQCSQHVGDRSRER